MCGNPGVGNQPGIDPQTPRETCSDDNNNHNKAVPMITTLLNNRRRVY